MSNPESKVKVDKGSLTKESKTQTFEDQVKEALNTMQEVKGKYVFADNIPDEVRIAANSERRRRDTFNSFTAQQQKLKMLEAENELLKQNQKFQVDIPKEMDDLKYSNPDEWRNRMNELEEKARIDASEKLNGVLTEAQKKAEIERRLQVLDQFIIDNPESKLSETALTNDVAPRITRKLENGTITWEQFLVEASDYLNTQKIINTGNKVLSQQSLSKVGGSSDTIVKPIDIEHKYKNTVF